MTTSIKRRSFLATCLVGLPLVGRHPHSDKRDASVSNKRPWPEDMPPEENVPRYLPRNSRGLAFLKDRGLISEWSIERTTMSSGYPRTKVSIVGERSENEGVDFGDTYSDVRVEELVHDALRYVFSWKSAQKKLRAGGLPPIQWPALLLPRLHTPVGVMPSWPWKVYEVDAWTSIRCLPNDDPEKQVYIWGRLERDFDPSRPYYCTVVAKEFYDPPDVIVFRHAPSWVYTFYQEAAESQGNAPTRRKVQ